MIIKLNKRYPKLVEAILYKAMQEKRAHNLTEFIFNQTKDVRTYLQAKYTQHKWKYYGSMYEQLIGCYQQNITEEVNKQLNSDSMLNYYSCYKKVLRQSKENNKKMYEEGLNIEIKLKQCVEIKSAMTKSTKDFENDRK